MWILYEENDLILYIEFYEIQTGTYNSGSQVLKGYWKFSEGAGRH